MLLMATRPPHKLIGRLFSRIAPSCPRDSAAEQYWKPKFTKIVPNILEKLRPEIDTNLR